MPFYNWYNHLRQVEKKYGYQVNPLNFANVILGSLVLNDCSGGIVGDAVG